uniref:Ku protein n=1 Tax=Streptomyces antimycoticus TaxID=68175 RepID=UPI002F908B94
MAAHPYASRHPHLPQACAAHDRRCRTRAVTSGVRCGLLRPPATTFPARHLLQLDPDLAQALARSFSKIAITKFAFPGRERLGALRVVGDTLVLQVMRWDDEIRSARASRRSRSRSPTPKSVKRWR